MNDAFQFSVIPLFQSHQRKFVPSVTVVQCCTDLTCNCMLLFLLWTVRVSGIFMPLSIPLDVIKLIACMDLFLIDLTCVPVSNSQSVLFTLPQSTKHS